MSEAAKKPNQSPESYSPKKPEILNMAEGQSNSIVLEENIIHGIPYMGYGNPSAVCYIGSVMRLMEYLNDPIEEDELFVLSGTAFCFPWKTGLCCDEVSILPEIPKRTFTALGYESEYIYEPNVYIEPYSLSGDNESINGQPKMTTNPCKYTKEFYIEKIKNSIDKGHPVIGFGLTELNFTCLITGYSKNGNGLYLRAYWAPNGTPQGYENDKYYYTEEWYDKCCGLLIIGDKISERLKGDDAYHYIRENARLLKEKSNESTQGDIFYNGFAAYDDMLRWLMDDNWWTGDCDMSYREMLLKPCGLLLLNHYRSYLYIYLQWFYKGYPKLINTNLISKLDEFCNSFPGSNNSQLYLNECVDKSITDFAILKDRSAREMVAVYIKRLKQLDQEIFGFIIEPEDE